MSEVKFACPHCAQHIACDDAYCGNPMVCPACGEKMFVPRLAAFTAPPPGKLTLALPVGTSARTTPHQPEFNAWTAEEWDKHAASLTGEKADLQPLVWFFLVTPFAISLILISRRAAVLAIPICFIFSALVAGFLWAQRKKLEGIKLILAGVACAIAVLAGYGCLAVALLIAGCALL